MSEATCAEFQANRRALSNIIYSKIGPFTSNEILEEYRAWKGNGVIDGVETVHGFISGLEELGALVKRGPTYTVVR